MREVRRHGAASTTPGTYSAATAVLLGSAALAATLVLASAPVEASGGIPQAPTPYNALTNTRRSVTNFNVETIRGMAFDSVQTRLYAINTHGSTLEFFTSTTTSAPTAVFRTLNNPSALALWDDGSGGKFAIVVGGGTHGVVKQDRNNGAIVSYLTLPSEPMDIVIDTQRNLAFVSCAGGFDDPSSTTGPVGGGVVIQIDLSTFTFNGGTPAGSGQHFINAARPTFLNIEMGPSTNDNFVFVAPFLSANRTTNGLDAHEDSQVIAAPWLPDDDLFRISETGVVASALTGAGTLLTAHGRNPATSKYWVLGVDSKNLAFHSEPEHTGRFAQNQIEIATTAVFPFTATAPVSLDTIAGAFPPMGAGNKPASFPTGLAFHSSGYAFVTSSTGDIVRILDPNGATVRNLKLPDGAIPRSLLLSPDGNTLFVYLWGTNRIFGFDVGPLFIPSNTNPAPQADWDLGVDPLPAAVKRGRTTWYDADNSNDPFNSVAGKVTCNTCHPRGGLDLLGWDLSGPPLDRKDTMVTQSLLSIEDTFPYHWRGERNLADFNGAFPGLLGGTALTPSALDDFQAFVFSLQGPANSRQHPDRLVDNSRTKVQSGTLAGNAVQGQNEFFNTPNVLVSFGQNTTCASCHGGEAGTNGQVTADVLTAVASNGQLDVSHLRQLGNKIFQPQFSSATTPVKTRPRGGFGFSQDGNDNDVLDFLSPAIFFTGLSNQTQRRVDTGAFVAQFDQGIAPRCHRAVRFASNTPVAEANTVANEMITQANAGWLDLAAIGHNMSGGVPTTELKLWFDKSAQLFRTAEASNPGGTSFTMAALEAQRTSGAVQLLVVGLPPGNGYRFAVDPDDDELSDISEAVSLTNRFSADTDGDSFPDGWEVTRGLDPLVTTSPATALTADSTAPVITSSTVDFVNGRVAKIFVTFSEPTTYRVDVQRKDAAGVFSNFGFQQNHTAVRTTDTLVAQGMAPAITDPSTGALLRAENYRLQVTMTDPVGNQRTSTLLGNGGATLNTRPTVLAALGISNFLPSLVVASLPTPSVNTTTGAVTATVDIDDIWQGMTNPLTLAGSKTVVLQLVTLNSSGGFSIPTSAMLTGSGGTRVVSSLVIQTGSVPQINYGLTTDPIAGPFILSPATSASGGATINFNVTGMISGTQARLVVIGIFDEALPATSPPQFLPESERMWSLPMTETAKRVASFSF